MWISKRKWKEVNVRIKKYEAHVCQCEEKIDTLIELTEGKLQRRVRGHLLIDG